ncbi:hypothetical protein [Psychrobacillus sp. L4]|uniref:hypothetical protein n=1 Tax=Psychrobacillus sp. L4 TaxID=3236892 RepID=UPI0036F201CE
MSIPNEINETIRLLFPKNVDYEDYITSDVYKKLVEKKKIFLSDNGYKRIDFKKSIQKLFNNYAVVDWTDPIDSNCFEFRVLMHRNQTILDDDIELIRLLGWKRLDLRIFISILNPYYYYFFEESDFNTITNEWSFSIHTVLEQELQNISNSFENFMDFKGYQGLSSEIVNKVVDDVETKFLEKGKVKVFHCLFTDLVTI